VIEKETFMNDTSPTQEENSAPSQAKKNTIEGDTLAPSQGKEHVEKHPNEQDVDLNELFPDTETDLNRLFPDAEVKHLLKNIIKNKKDMGSIKERLANENKISDENKKEDTFDDSPELDNTETD
jgi:hypothetical protein